jgi:hypothetical protein
MGVKGGCSPQNNRENFEPTKRASSRWQQLYTKKFSPVSTIVTTRQTQEINSRKKSTNKLEQEA